MTRPQLAAACRLSLRQLNYRLRLYFPELIGRHIRHFTPLQVQAILEVLLSDMK
jgi:hypothetical protein